MEGNRGDRLAPGSSTQGPTPPLPVGHSQRLEEKTCGKSNSYHAYLDQGIHRCCGLLPCPPGAFISLCAGAQPCQTRGASLSHRGPAMPDVRHLTLPRGPAVPDTGRLSLLWGAQPCQTRGASLSRSLGPPRPILSWPAGIELRR